MKQYESLRYVNSRGESITFGIGSKYHVNVQKDVTGISDITNTIYSAGSMGQHGDTLVGNRIEPRDIEITGKIQDPDKDTQLRLRREAVRILIRIFWARSTISMAIISRRSELRPRNLRDLRIRISPKSFPSSSGAWIHSGEMRPRSEKILPHG